MDDRSEHRRDNAVVLDLDGTLVDSVYVHVVAWTESFAAAGRPQSMWRIHRAIGLGSDRLIANLLATTPEEDLRDQLVDGHRRRFLDRAGDLRRTRGALDLLADLEGREVPTVVATSAGGEEREALMAALDDPDLDVTDADAADDSKPSPAPLLTAVEQLPTTSSVVMVGDTVWDGYAAMRAGLSFVGVRCGGIADAELAGAGAELVIDDPAGLVGLL